MAFYVCLLNNRWQHCTKSFNFVTIKTVILLYFLLGQGCIMLFCFKTKTSVLFIDTWQWHFQLEVGCDVLVQRHHNLQLNAGNWIEFYCDRFRIASCVWIVTELNRIPRCFDLVSMGVIQVVVTVYSVEMVTFWFRNARFWCVVWRIWIIWIWIRK